MGGILLDSIVRAIRISCSEPALNGQITGLDCAEWAADGNIITFQAEPSAGRFDVTLVSISVKKVVTCMESVCYRRVICGEICIEYRDRIAGCVVIT
jgi:hypothetical protein